ncbi:MAG: hypothetical protein IT520_10245 [Burkholderiales bacterium]|nr:hypothetical protein [Burkholderiales bacterium]
MRNERIDGGEAIVQALRDLRIEYVVSSPGSDWGPVWEALARQQERGDAGPVYLNCPHELLAVDVALGYTAMTGKMQAVLLHAGVGLLQGSMGINGARVGEIPMLVMSGESTSFGDREGFDPGPQWYHNHNVAGGLTTYVRPFVKWAQQAGAAEHLYEIVLRAGEIAMAAPAGPAYLDVPLESMVAPWRKPPRTRVVPPPPKLDATPADLDAAARTLLSAKDPLVIAGSPGRTSDGYDALVELAESLALPVVEAASSEIGSFPTAHPLHQGFDAGARLATADVVLVVRSRAPWYPPARGAERAHVIVVDEVPFRTHMAYQNLAASALLAGDVPATLRKLAAALRSAAAADPAIGRRVADRRARLAEAHGIAATRRRSEVEDARAQSGIAPAALAAAIADAMPESSIYVDETTSHLRHNRRHLPYRGAQSYHALRAGLGQGLGYALGVKLATPDRPVVALLGDGAFLYNPTLSCLGFSRDRRLPLLIVVYDNRGYRAMRDSQLLFYPDGVARDARCLGEPISGFDYERAAALFGGTGIRVDTYDALGPALREAVAAVNGGRTAIVNVRVNE